MALPGADIFERSGLKAWPAVEVEWDGAWVRRAAKGYTKRANSVQSLDPADDDNVVTRIAEAESWFRARGLQPVFRVTPLAGSRTVAALDELSWRSLDASHYFAMPLDATEADSRCQSYEVLDPHFLAVTRHLQRYSEHQIAGLTALLSALRVPARAFVCYDPDGAPSASSLMSVADGIVLTGNVVTDPGQRRKGYAKAMMRTGLAWAYEAGARIAALHVLADNGVAQALYGSLGYVHQYSYHFRTPVGA